MSETVRKGFPTTEEALQGLVGSGCRVEVDGSVTTLFDLNNNPVVEIREGEQTAIFMDEYHQTAGAIPELGDLIASFDSKGFRVGMD